VIVAYRPGQGPPADLVAFRPLIPRLFFWENESVSPALG